MWLTTQWKLRRALRRYRRDGDVDAVLGADWSRSREIFAFFREIVDRLHGEEITRLRQKQAEYLALQNQINPHFLFNTLNNISSLVQIDQDTAQESIGQLSDLLRYTLYESNHELVPVEGEIEFMNNLHRADEIALQ